MGQDLTEMGHNEGHRGFDTVYSISEDVPKVLLENGKIIYVCRLRNKVKIGITREPQKRIIQLECGCGEFFNKIYISTPRAEAADHEASLHHYFQMVRGVGEWFHADFDDVVDTVRNIHDLERRWLEGEYYPNKRGKPIECHESRRAKLKRKARKKRGPSYTPRLLK